MSGILAVFNRNGAPVNGDTFARLLGCSSLRLRGPHKTASVVLGHVALGHTLLRTTRESVSEQQPFSLDGRTWIVADARVDARHELIESLCDEEASLSSSDAELILRAYQRWGERCVERILGDFAVVIWNGAERQLFCARDQMGVKPFYYADRGPSLIVSSTIESIRRHADITAALNELAVVDFLQTGFNQDPHTTTFRDIQRLAPAHYLTVGGSGVTLRRYWALPVEPLQYRPSETDYVDEFRSLVRTAVSDRLRTDKVNIYLSGGLDSSTLAATSKELLTGSQADAVRGYCVGYERFEDEEPAFAGVVARHLGIPLSCYVADRRREWSDRASALPEPSLDILDPEPQRKLHEDMAGHSCVAFYGEGPDNALLYEWGPHLRALIARRQWLRATRDVAFHVAAHRRVPLLPSVPKLLRNRLWRTTSHLAVPPFLRTRGDGASNVDAPVHPTKPRAYSSLRSPQWQMLFENCEPAYTGASLEVRSPYVDLRLLQFLLRVPSMPWSRSKYLMRRALVGQLPADIRGRPKSPLAGDPVIEQLAQLGPPVIEQAPGLDYFVDVSSITRDTWKTQPYVYPALRTAALSYWLRAV